MVVGSLEGDLTESQNVYITSKICKEHITSISITDWNFCRSPHSLEADTRKNCESLLSYHLPFIDLELFYNSGKL